MALGTIGTGVNIQTYLKFVECCSGTEILFSGSLAVTNGSVYLFGGTVPFSGTGGSLQPGRCYTITTITASGVITYPVTPPIALISLTSGCQDEACFNCNPANPCDCPEGYVIIDGFCVGIETVNPIPPTTIVFTGNSVDPGGGFGLVTFQSLNNFVWPLFTTPQLIGDIAAMTIIPNTGNNPVTGDSWTALNPLPQTGINAGKHQPITTATPGGFPALPSPPNPPASPPLRPLRESTITGTTLNYGAGNPIGYDNYEPGTPPWDDWYTDVAVWTLPGLSVVNQYAGFLVCLEPEVETTYQVIMTGNNGVRLFVDDYLAVEMLNGNGLFQALAYNNHFQITLSPGLHVLRLECYNYTGGGGLAAEVLECSAATVYGFTSLADFIPYRKFSTLWKKSRNLQITATGTNIITLTSGTTLPSDTSGFIVQTSGTGFPANTFVTSVINSTTYIVNQNVPNGVYNSCRIQFAYDVSSIASNSFSCPEGFTLTTCEGIACVRTVELPCSSNCYLVMPCNNEDSFVSNSFDLEEFVDSFVTVETDNFYGCAYIVKLDENDCKDAVEVTVYPDEICDCDLRCFYVANSNGFLYVDENDVLQEVSSVEANPYIKVCSKVYPVVQNDSQNYEIINFGNCINNTCPEQCFKLTKCYTNPETIIYSNTASLLDHAVNNDIITINGKEGCWEVTESIANCDCITVTIEAEERNGLISITEYTATLIAPYNGWNRWTFTIGSDNYFIWNSGVNPSSSWSISKDSSGLIPGTLYAESKLNSDCPETITDGTLTGWVIQGGNNWINIQTEICPAECDCPIPVTVLESYPTCEECLPIVNYKFTNCNNQAIIRYSIEDYSAYVGKTVELECGECWFVSEIDYIPPSTQSIVILYTFDNCTACNRTYYKLTDCLDPNVNVAYTYTDLSNYIDQVIKIKGCDTCFTVEETREPINAGIVTVTDSYLDCPECLASFPCECTQVTNTTLVEQTYCYLDCDFNQQSIVLLPGESSEKICVINWIACPSNDCNCLILELGISQESNKIYNWKLKKTALIKNGKPVYDGVIFSQGSNLWEFTLSYEFDNCWYSFFTDGNNNDAEIPPFILCEDIDCPIGEWTQLECACIDVTFATNDLNFNETLLVTYIDENNNYVYQDGGGVLNYEISYNILLGRWEFKDYQTEELLAYYVTSSKCPYTGTTLPVSWTVVNVSNTFSVNGFCTGDIQEITFNTTQCLQECECINMALTVDDNDIPIILYGVLQPTGDIVNGKTEYEYNTVEGIFIISWDSITNCWLLIENGETTVATLCNSLNANCPIGTWLSTDVGIINAVSEFCTDGTTTVGTTTLPEYIQNFGNCINGACPVEIIPKRKVKPGYSTPSCDIEKYEKITCRSSEILYKQVIRLRYGISNCCPEDDEKWLIKKELIDLDALRDPDYICRPVTSCCNQPINDCGCNTLKTCNS